MRASGVTQRETRHLPPHRTAVSNQSSQLHRNRASPNSRPDVAEGWIYPVVVIELAWCVVGGDILFI
jgi:hypothetical protein